jgi:hypothetical protein
LVPYAVAQEYCLLSKRTLFWLKAFFTSSKAPTAVQRAKDLVAAVDAGGMPLNPARVNDIARQLGLEVSTRAAMPDTIERIRLALQRS